MRVIVTRPRAQADDWVRALRERGVDAVAVPLIGIEAPGDRAALQATWASLAAYAAVMFVSANAVREFFEAAPPGRGWPAGTLAACTGPGTSAALLERGVPPAAIAQPPADAPQFDSEQLWGVLRTRDWRGQRVLLVRGEGGRDWLAEQWQGAGAAVERLEVYRRALPEWTPDERAWVRAAMDAPRRHCWLFSSSQAIAHLEALVPRPVHWPAHRAVATHPRIAEAARALGFGRVHECPPAIDAVVACLESLVS